MAHWDYDVVVKSVRTFTRSMRECLTVLNGNIIAEECVIPLQQCVH